MLVHDNQLDFMRFESDERASKRIASFHVRKNRDGQITNSDWQIQNYSKSSVN